MVYPISQPHQPPPTARISQASAGLRCPGICRGTGPEPRVWLLDVHLVDVAAHHEEVSGLHEAPQLAVRPAVISPSIGPHGDGPVGCRLKSSPTRADETEFGVRR